MRAGALFIVLSPAGERLLILEDKHCPLAQRRSSPRIRQVCLAPLFEFLALCLSWTVIDETSHHNKDSFVVPLFIVCPLFNYTVLRTVIF